MKLWLLILVIGISAACKAQNRSSSAVQRVQIVIPPRIHVESILQLGTPSSGTRNKPIHVKERFNIQSNKLYTVNIDTLVNILPEEKVTGTRKQKMRVMPDKPNNITGYIAHHDAAKQSIVYTITEI